MGLFKKRQPLDSLHVDPLALNEGAMVQDNVAGPDSLDYEEIEDAEAAREEERYLARTNGIRGIGWAMRRAEQSVARPEKDPSDD
jgi:hypothetical protein